MLCAALPARLSAGGRYYARPCCAPAYAAPAYYAPSYPVYHAPVVVQKEYVYVKEPPVLQPVVIQEQLAPAYSFQVLTAYQPPTQTIAQTYGRGGYTQGQQLAPAPVQAAPQPPAATGGAAYVKLDPGQLKELARMLKGSAGAPEDAVPELRSGQTEQVSLTRPETAEALGNSGKREATPDEVRVLKFFGQNCSACHQDGKPVRGKVVLFDGAGYWAPRRTDNTPLSLADIYNVCETGQMPPGARTDQSKRVPKDVLDAMIGWKSEGERTASR